MEISPSPVTLSTETVDYLKQRGELVAIPAGQALLRQGQPGRALYVLLSGEVEVRLEGHDGRPLRLRKLGPGGIFGEMSLLTGEPVSADVTALVDVSVLVYPGELLSQALAECGPLRDEILANLANNLRSTNRDFWALHRRTEALNVFLDPTARFGRLVAESEPMGEVRETLRRLSTGREPVLFTGETGTGKVFAAAALHREGAGSDAPFIVVDCERLESRDTGALRRCGALQLSDPGTLVLRHVDALDLGAQAELLRHMERMRDEPAAHVGARVVATTTEDLLDLVRQGRFDARLAQSFSEVVRMPTLWERRKDVVPLAGLFLEDRGERGPVRISESAERVLNARRFRHGNVTELREAVHLAALFAQDGQVRAEHIFTGPKELVAPAEYDLSRIPFVRWLVSPPTLGGLRALVFLSFSGVLLASLAAPHSRLGHTANSLIWGFWEPSLILLYLFAGRVWCTVCPLSTAGRLARRLARFDRAPPGWVKEHSVWLLPAGFLVIVSSQQIFDMPERPAAAALLLLSLMAGAAAFAVVYTRETWCRYLCPMGGWGALYSLSSLLGVRADPGICATSCITHECHNGSADQPACPVFHHPLYARDAHVCKLCFNCLSSCPHGSTKLYLRPPLLRIWRQADLGTGLGLFALVFFFASYFMLASHHIPWFGTTAGAVAGALLSAALAAGLQALLPRLLSGGPGVEPSASYRVALALVLLAWGPAAAFQLGNSPALAALELRTLPGSFWSRILPGGALPLEQVAQLLAVAVAAALAALTLCKVGSQLRREGVNLSAERWSVLVGVGGGYFAAAVATILAGP